VGSITLLVRTKRSLLVGCAAGLVMVGWITGETILLRGFSWLQAFYLITGLIVVTASLHLVGQKRTIRTPWDEE